jgi:hypothetical protein
MVHCVSPRSAVGIATGWMTEGSEFESRWGQEFSLLHVVQTGSGVHLTYPMGTGGSFSGDKAAGAWSWPLTSNQCRGQANIDLYIHHTPSWCDNFPSPYFMVYFTSVSGMTIQHVMVGWLSDEWMKWMHLEASDTWPSQDVVPTESWRDCRETHKKNCQNSWCRSRDSNRGPLDYSSRALLFHQPGQLEFVGTVT